MSKDNIFSMLIFFFFYSWLTVKMRAITLINRKIKTDNFNLVI